jgi:alpha-glucosidase
MPYIYTVAEEASRTGLPIERPLFLEFPDAARDRHPIDIDLQAAGEFLLGPDMLIAAPPYPEKLDNYMVEFPSAKWFDYWTGQPVLNPVPVAPDPNAPSGPDGLVPLTNWIHPEVASLPVFVRAGAILPIAPLMQSTNETPQGPLTLRVYVGDACSGHLYLDDGKTYAYMNAVRTHTPTPGRDSRIRSVKQETRSLVSFSHRDFARALEGVEHLTLLWIKHIIDPSLETRVGPH